jgi:RND family efflux transporter MFP subunit
MNQRWSAMLGTLAAAALALVAAPAPGASDALRDDGWIEAVTEAETDLELAFTIPGRVTEVLVKPGDHVEAGQPLVRLDDREVAATVSLLRLRADSDLAIEEAGALLDLARNELAKVEQAHAQAAVSDFEVQRARLDAKRREVALAKAKQEKEEAKLQLDQALATAERYVLRTPEAGVVESVSIEQGETVQELKPVVRVVSVDPLRIDVAAPLESTLGLKPGAEAEVAWAEGSGGPLGTGRVVYIASVADAASGTRLIRVRLANPGLAPAGARVKVRFRPHEGEVGGRASSGQAVE